MLTVLPDGEVSGGAGDLLASSWGLLHTNIPIPWTGALPTAALRHASPCRSPAPCCCSLSPAAKAGETHPSSPPQPAGRLPWQKAFQSSAAPSTELQGQDLAHPFGCHVKSSPQPAPQEPDGEMKRSPLGTASGLAEVLPAPDIAAVAERTQHIWHGAPAYLASPRWISWAEPKGHRLH